MAEQGIYALALMIWCFIGAKRVGKGPREDLDTAIFLSVIATLLALRGLWLLVKGIALRDFVG